MIKFAVKKLYIKVITVVICNLPLTYDDIFLFGSARDEEEDPCEGGQYAVVRRCNMILFRTKN